MKAKLLINDTVGRFKAGEIGKLIENDFPKYDYCVDLGSALIDSGTIQRVFYFYKDEVEIIQERHKC